MTRLPLHTNSAPRLCMRGEEPTALYPVSDHLSPPTRGLSLHMHVYSIHSPQRNSKVLLLNSILASIVI